MYVDQEAYKDGIEIELLDTKEDHETYLSRKDED